MDWAESLNEPNLLQDLVHAALPYWAARGESTEGRQRVDRLLHRTETWTPIHTELLGFAATAAYDRGDYRAALATAETMLTGCRAAKDNLGTVAALASIASYSAMLGDRARSLAVADECLQFARAQDDQLVVLVALNGFVTVLIELREYHRVVEEAERALQLALTLDHPGARMVILGNKGHAHLALGQIQQARELYQEALMLANAAEQVTFVWYMLVSLAAAAAKASDLVRAATLLGAADTIQAALESTLDPYEARLYAETVESTRAGLSRSACEDSRAIGETMGRESVVAYALAEFTPDDA
jgi:tetratricopeptide (TPR) repeat protein